jgi:hypothetical protein
MPCQHVTQSIVTAVVLETAVPTVVVSTASKACQHHQKSMNHPYTVVPWLQKCGTYKDLSQVW